MAISKAMHKANEKYNKNNYDTILIRVKKGEKELLQTVAHERGESLNKFITQAINERITRG